MPLIDRTVPLCDLLLGAAYADAQFKERERDAVRETLAELSGTTLSNELENQIAAFDPEAFDLAKTAASFAEASEEDRRRVLALVAAINDADEEFDLAEDEYLRDLASALKLPEDAVKGLTIEVEIEELRQDFAKVRMAPPPVPGKATKASPSDPEMHIEIED